MRTRVGVELARAQLALELAGAAVESGDWLLVAEQADALAAAAGIASVQARAVAAEVAATGTGTGHGSAGTDRL